MRESPFAPFFDILGMKPSSTVSDGVPIEIMESESDHILQEAAMGCKTCFMLDCRADGYVLLFLQKRAIGIENQFMGKRCEVFLGRWTSICRINEIVWINEAKQGFGGLLIGAVFNVPDKLHDVSSAAVSETMP